MWGVFLDLFYCLCRLCSSNSLEMERNEPTHSEDPNSGASSSWSSPLVGDYEGGTKQTEGNDYEVFLSFRGKDTRKGFTDYLYTSLVDARVHVFRDDNELRVGEEIGPELLRNITQSKIAIPIISEDYASSKWCLYELAHMLKCKRNGGQTILPIFYKVEPSQLRNPSGRLIGAINAYKKKLGKIVAEEWEQALKEVSCLKGWESEKVENGHEGALVKIVVGKVMSELKRFFQLNVPELLVGIDDPAEHIMSKIDDTFNGTWIIGIYGMGGIGKTTLAKVLYNKLSSRFEDRSFLADIRETSKRKGIECLQKQLISDMIRKSFDVSNVDEGVSVIKSRFISKKILVLLDDMDDIAHLNALFGDHSWFKAGSIVIMTTRNKSILDKARADHMYPLNELPLDKSLILFSRHAFRKDSPKSDYEVISGDVISTTGGLPLALEIIGSFLCGKTKNVWEDTLKKLKQAPNKIVQETLRISYDTLEYEEQQIFLDIACIFIGIHTEAPTYVWDACGFFPEKGIEVLSLMSLIKIDEDGNLMMHDQLRDFGREIVRQENQREPQKRSRLWITKEAADVIYNNKGTGKIEALCLDKDDGRESYTVENFKQLTNLRYLLLKGVNITGDFHNFLPQLRWLEWENCCLDFEEANFHPKKLILLCLWDSQISEDWGGWGPLKMAMELKVLVLSNCALRTTPDLSAFNSLETLELYYCKDLEEIHPSIEDIKTLVTLIIIKCHKLKELTLGVGRMKELKALDASYCRQLARLPESLGSLISLTQLNLSNTGIEELPESIGSLKELEILDVSYCKSLAYIPNSIGNLTSLSHLDLNECQKLAQLPESIGSLVYLQWLSLSKCHSLRQIPDSIGKLTSLTELHLKSTAIEELPESIGSLKELKTLDASYCKSLAHIPNSIGNLTSLSSLDLNECQKLAQLPESIGSLMSLLWLLLSGCHSLKQIPDSIGKLTSLIELHLKSTAIEELPKSIVNMQNLRMLDIDGTPMIELLDDPGILAKLKGLRASTQKNMEGSLSNNGQLVSPNDLGLDELQKLSKLRSRVLSLDLLKRSKTPPANNLAMDYQTTDERPLKRSKPFGISNEVNNLPGNIFPITYNYQSFGQSSYSSDDLPRNVVVTLSHDSLVKSMDFHPWQQILLLVGTNTGDVMVWDVSNHARIALRKFKVWDLGTCSMVLQASLANDYTASINRVTWSPDGLFFGVAYSKHMVHIYSYYGGDDMRNHLELEPHVGSVNDLAFSYPNKRLCIVTCGEDRSIKVWDAETGAKQHTFEGHEAPVYSICPHHKENIQFTFSIATDGKIKAWLYDNMGSRIDYDAPGHSSTVMAYDADGKRLFSCGTNKEGESYLVEWNESEGAIEHTYHGLGKSSSGVVQFDTIKNRFLAAGDEFMVKFWDMNNDSLLTSTDADGGLLASPCIRFNKEGILLAVSTSDNSIKILANSFGILLLRTAEKHMLLESLLGVF